MNLHILFPSDYFDRKKVDDIYQNEYEIAKALGFECYLFSYDEFLSNGDMCLYPKLDILPENSTHEMTVIMYRGWMLSINKYRELYAKLNSRGLTLLNSEENYENCHHFNKSYKYLEEYTPNILVLENALSFDVSKLKDNFNDYFMMKDNAKSVKGQNFPNKISVNITQKEFNELVSDFILKRGNLYTGQIILKQFVDLKLYGANSNEWRAVYFYGEPITVTKNSNQNSNAKKVPDSLLGEQNLRALNSLFYTIDFAETNDNKWIIIETGDGGVSGLTPSQNILEYYSKILNRWNEMCKQTL